MTLETLKSCALYLRATAATFRPASVCIGQNRQAGEAARAKPPQVVASRGRRARRARQEWRDYGQHEEWMLGAAMVAGIAGIERSARPGGARRNLCWRWRTGGLRSALPWTGIRLGGRLLGRRLLGARLLELRGRRPSVAHGSRRRCGGIAARPSTTAILTATTLTATDQAL